MKLLALLSALTAFVLRERYGYSWFYTIPIFIGYFLAFHGYRMLIYERFISPIARVPGPKACPLSGVKLIPGSLATWRIRRNHKRRTRPSPPSLASTIPKSNWPHMLPRTILHSSNNANFQYSNPTHFE
jgi:hypothetical protein